MLSRRVSARRGASTVEFAMVAPVLFLLLFGLVIGGLGIFRYYQVASLAREAARYACVRGLDYERETGNPAATQDSIRNEVILKNAVGLDPNRLTCTVTWDRNNLAKYGELLPDGTYKVTTNEVIVTISYLWVPEALFLPALTLSSTSKMPMSQ
jgi:Flp pilus assembly protein TadG